MKLNEEKWQALLEDAPQVIVVVAQDGRIVFVNARAEEMFGYDQGELIGQTVEILLPKRSWEVHTGHRARYISNPRTRPMGSGLNPIARRKDGTEFPVEIGLSAIETENGVLVTSYITDITQQKRAEEELLQLNASLEQRTRQLTALHEIGRTLAATLDLSEIYRVMFREIAQGLLGTSYLVVALFDQETETIRCGFAIVDEQEMDPTELPPIPLGEGPVSDTIRTREPRIVDLQEAFPRLKERGRAVQVGGERQPKSALYVPMIGGDKVVGVMQMRHFEADAFREADMSLLSILASQAAVAITNAQSYAQEQERVDALSRALKQQRELDRLKNEFIQNVSHELRTPLGIIYGYAELLDRGELGELQPMHKEPLNIITRRVRMLRKMVDTLITILETDTQELKPEPVQLADLVQTLLTDFRVVAEQAGLTLKAEVAPNLPPVSGNPTHLHQVLDNLMSNAIKFTPAGGSVSLRLWQEGTDVMLEAADTGIGIPPDQLGRIFERFYQVDSNTTRRYSGTGLGLALVQDIVQAHGGQVTVQSTLGEGSTFQVRLPLHPHL
jgi:PAS domain S-box-containing protein